jgi:hypothetical protein
MGSELCRIVTTGLITMDKTMNANIARLRTYVLAAALPLIGACGGEASSEPLRRIEALEARVDRLEKALAAEPQSARPRPLAQP